MDHPSVPPTRKENPRVSLRVRWLVREPIFQQLSLPKSPRLVPGAGAVGPKGMAPGHPGGPTGPTPHAPRPASECRQPWTWLAHPPPQGNVLSQVVFQTRGGAQILQRAKRGVFVAQPKTGPRPSRSSFPSSLCPHEEESRPHRPLTARNLSLTSVPLPLPVFEM